MLALYYVPAFLVAIGLLVVVHELGHYLVARWVGVKVLRFSFGFGRTLLSRKAGPDQTEWSIGAIPLGGYVKMLDLREGVVSPDELPRAFNSQSVWHRCLIVLAGPVANLLLAVLIYWGIAVAGMADIPPIIGSVAAGSAAERAGLVEGDRLERLRGASVTGWAELRWMLVDQALGRSTVDVDILRGGVSVTGLSLDLSNIEVDERAPDIMQQIGLAPPAPKLSAVLGFVQPGSVAERAGFSVGDRVIAIDGRPIEYWHEVVARITQSPGMALTVQVERAGRTLSLHVVPEAVSGRIQRGRIGVQVQIAPGELAPATVKVSYGPWAGLRYALQRTWDTAAFSLKVMGRMVTGSVSLRNVSGPVTIADYAGRSAQVGPEAYLSFIALVSVSIGVLNLLPIPILDGGHLMYYVAEILRGRPLPERLEEWGQKLGLVFLAGLMSLAIFNDLNRIFFG